jgi:hypothetical protein
MAITEICHKVMASNGIWHTRDHLCFMKTSCFMHYMLGSRKNPQNCERLGEVYPLPRSNYMERILFFCTFYIKLCCILLILILRFYVIFLYDFHGVQRIIVQLENGGIRIQKSIL